MITKNDVEEKIESFCKEPVGENGKGIYDLAELRDYVYEAIQQSYYLGKDKREQEIKDRGQWLCNNARSEEWQGDDAEQVAYITGVTDTINPETFYTSQDLVSKPVVEDSK